MPQGSRGHVYIAWSRLHARAYVQQRAVSEGLSVCSVYTRVCVLLGTTVSAYMRTW